MFSQARNVIINGGSFATSNGSPYHFAWQILQDHVVFGAVHDSAERFDPPKCHPSTRAHVLATILGWARSTSSCTRFLWLYGPAGAGKSAIAQSIAELCQANGFVVASFFFSRNTERRSGTTFLVSTIAYQLSSAIQDIQGEILQKIECDPALIQRSLQTQLERLIIEPLNRLHIDGSRNCRQYIIIDGLDECNDPKAEAHFVTALATALQRSTSPIRILVASRPEKHIQRLFKDTAIQVITSELDLQRDFAADTDIQTFLREKFAEIKLTHPLKTYLPEAWPSEEDIATLVRKSSGQFVYASTVVRYVQALDYHPIQRLEIILGFALPPTNHSPFADLDALYSQVLSSVDDIQGTLLVLGVLLLPEDRAIGKDAHPDILDRVLRYQPGRVQLLLNKMVSIVSYDRTKDLVIQVLHASLSDFLLDETRSRGFHVDLKAAHTALVRGYLHLASQTHMGGEGIPYADVIVYHGNFVRHCWLAPPSKELTEDVLAFELRQVYKNGRSNAKYWSSTDLLLLWRFVHEFFECITKSEALRDAKEVLLHHQAGFDHHLRTLLKGYLAHPCLIDSLTVFGIYHEIPELDSRSGAILGCVNAFLDPYIALHVHCIDQEGIGIRGLLLLLESSAQDFRLVGNPDSKAMEGYVSLICSFLKDRNRSIQFFTSPEKYAQAALRSLRLLCEPRNSIHHSEPLDERDPMAKKYQGLLTCVPILLSQAAPSHDLVLFLSQNRIRGSLVRSGWCDDSVDVLQKGIDRYLATRTGGIIRILSQFWIVSWILLRYILWIS